MIILGIDPGIASIGYALLETTKRTVRFIEAGLLPTASTHSIQRLKKLRHGLNKILKRHRPERMAVERLFFAKNKKTALAVAEARGVILLTALEAGIKVYEYTPLEIKYAVSGDGRADKTQLKKMLGLLLPEIKKRVYQDDALDAIAVALTCHFKELSS